MKYSIRKNWISTFELLIKRPVIFIPFIFIAFLEGLALELIYFFPRKPVSFVSAPIVRKFLGEPFTHYPGHLLITPKLFYYAQVIIYIVIGVLLSAVTVNIFKNIKAGLPLKPNALIKNASRAYFSFFLYGILIIILASLLKKLDLFLVGKFFRLASRYLSGGIAGAFPFIAAFGLFISNAIIQTFLILTLPIMVIRKKPLFKALGGSIYLGARNFLSIFPLIFVPFLAHLPIALFKTFSVKLVDLTFPEINLYVAGAGIVISLFVDCFMLASLSQFLLDSES